MPFLLKVNSKEVSIPTSWIDISLGEYLTFLQTNLTKLAFLQSLSVYPYLLNLPESFAEDLILHALRFLDEEQDWQSMPVPLQYHGLAIPFDLGECSYGQKVDAFTAIQECSSDATLAAADILAIYLMPEPYDFGLKEVFAEAIREMPVIDALPIFYHLKAKLDELDTELAAGLKQIPYRDEEIRAGVKDLEIWGHYAIADNLSGGNLLRMNKIFQLPASEVHTRILYNNHRAYYSYRLSEEDRKTADRNRDNRCH